MSKAMQADERAVSWRALCELKAYICIHGPVI